MNQDYLDKFCIFKIKRISTTFNYGIFMISLHGSSRASLHISAIAIERSEETFGWYILRKCLHNYYILCPLLHEVLFLVVLFVKECVHNQDFHYLSFDCYRKARERCKHMILFFFLFNLFFIKPFPVCHIFLITKKPELL